MSKKKEVSKPQSANVDMIQAAIDVATNEGVANTEVVIAEQPLTIPKNVSPTLESKPVMTLDSEPKGIRIGDIVRVTKEYYGDVVIDSPHATTARWDNNMMVIETPEGQNPVLLTQWETRLDIIPAQHLILIREG